MKDRQLVLAVALGARSAWSMASGGGSRRYWRTAAIAVLSPGRHPVARSVPAQPGSSSVNIRSLRVSSASSVSHKWD